MVVDRPFQADVYEYDPETQLFKYTNTRGQEVSTTLEVLTGGNFRVTGNHAIQHIGDVPGFRSGQLLGSISTINPARLATFAGNRAVLFNEAPLAELGRQRLRVGNYALSAETSLTLADGRTFNFPIRFAPLNREGMTPVVREVGGEIVQWGSISNRPDELTGTVEQPLGGWRFATPNEQILRSIYGSLLNHFFDDIAAIAKAGLADENGNPIETETGAAMYLARLAYNNITGGWVAQL